MKKFSHLSVLLDCSRNAVMNIPSVKRYIDYLAALGYSSLQLYTEDTYEMNGQPYFGYMRGRYTKAELKELDEYAWNKGIELIPCVQTLAHLNQMFRWNCFSPIRDFSEELLVDEPKTYEFLETMLLTVKECFRTRRINVGMDEAVMVGMGKYLKQHGYTDRFALMLRHLHRVNDLLQKHGFEPMMWSDMLFTLVNNGEYYDPATTFEEEKLKEVPKNVKLLYWDYYSLEQKHYEDMIAAHRCFDNEIWFAGGALCWVGFTPHNKFALKHYQAALPACEKGGIQNIIVTLWGDDGKECSFFAMLPTLTYVACYNDGDGSDEGVQKRFLELTGYTLSDFLALDSADEPRTQADTPNPSKYMLYNDCFTGLFDCYVFGGEGKTYEGYANTLKGIVKKYGEGGEFTYLFEEQYHLCKTLSYKYELGVRIRRAYKAGDRKALKRVCQALKKAIEEGKAFYKAFAILWERENKPFGWEIQDTRVGGLLSRMERCLRVLKEYLQGKRSSLEELEEEILDFQCRENPDDRLPMYNLWGNVVSANRI